MSVELDPAELGFKRPFTHEVSQTLRLRNPHSDPVAFKVKTTAPKQYCVRPNSGRIDAGSQVEVQVLLQAMKEDPPPDARCRDKFLVQSVAVNSANDANSVSQIWSNIEQTAKSSIQEKKIRVSFLPAEGSTDPADIAAGAGAGAGAAAGAAGMATATAARLNPNGTAASQDDDDHPPTYSSPSPPAVTPQKSRSESADKSPSPEYQNSSMLGNTAAAISSAVPTSQADLQKQLDDAKATISRLQSQASEGLRQRKGASGDGSGEKSGGALGMQNVPAPGGVSIPIVAGLCLLCFLIAYMFF